jgi:hypothetical protein
MMDASHVSDDMQPTKDNIVRGVFCFCRDETDG